MGTSVSYRRHQLTSVSAPSCGHDRMRRRVSTQAPWVSVFWSGGGGRKWGVFGRVLGRQRTWRDLGLGSRPDRVSNWGCLLGPFFGGPGPIFQSVETL